MTIFQFINRSIKWQMFTSIIVITVIPIMIFDFLFYNTLLTRSESKYIQYTKQLTRQLSSNLDLNMNELDKIITPVYYNDELESILKGDDLDAKLRSQKVLNGVFFNSIYSRENIYELELFSVEGESITSVNTFPISLNQKDEAWFKQTLSKGGKRYIFVTHNKDNTSGSNSSLISMSRAIYDHSNKIAGVIRVNESRKVIENTLLNIKFDYNSAVLVITDEGDIVYDSDAVFSDEFHKNTEFHNTLMNSADSSNFIQPIQNEDYSITISKSAFSGFTVILLTPKSEITKDSQIMKDYFSWFFVLYVAAILIISLLFSHKISKPIITIRKLMKSVEQENFNVRTEVKGKNEIAQLARGFNRMVDKINQLIKNEYRMKILKKEAELNVLQNQINPHFLYNTLTSIKGLFQGETKDSAAHGKSMVAVQMVQALSNLFRYNLDGSSHFVKLTEEIENVKNYIFIQKLRFEDKIQFSFVINEEILDVSILKMTLQPLVENAIIHGMELKRGLGEIIIAADRDDGTIVITITDNGAGMTENKLIEINDSLLQGEDKQFAQAQKEVGIFNVNARLKYYFGQDYGLQYEHNQPEGIRVKVTFPLKHPSD